MAELATGELRGMDAAFSGNRLLSTFPPEVRALIEPFATIVALEAGDIINARGADVLTSIFPFGATMISMIVELGDDRSLEVGSIGREGAVGGIVSCGFAPAFARTQVQVPGPALSVKMAALEDAKGRSSFLGNLFCRYSDYLLAQVMQSAACNSFHPIHQRAARWLLTAQDRAGDRIELTQEALAGLLGVQRTTINAVVKCLQDEKLIAVRRGSISVTDRAGLKRHSCECYAIVEWHFAATIGPSGFGGVEADC